MEYVRMLQMALGSAVILSTLGACATTPHSPVGFRLPEGDVEQGRAAFIALECVSCHTVEGADLPAPTLVDSPSRSVILGGQVFEVRTDGYLVTSIIHPSHRLALGFEREQIATSTGESRMPDYSDIMTVRQMIDLVAFLQSRYIIVPLPQPPQ